jgi:hypothetical protein
MTVCPHVGAPVMPTFTYRLCNLRLSLTGCPSTNYTDVFLDCPILKDDKKVKERLARLEALKL